MHMARMISGYKPLKFMDCGVPQSHVDMALHTTTTYRYNLSPKRLRDYNVLDKWTNIPITHSLFRLDGSLTKVI